MSPLCSLQQTCLLLCLHCVLLCHHCDLLCHHRGIPCQRIFCHYCGLLCHNCSIESSWSPTVCVITVSVSAIPSIICVITVLSLGIIESSSATTVFFYVFTVAHNTATLCIYATIQQYDILCSTENIMVTYCVITMLYYSLQVEYCHLCVLLCITTTPVGHHSPLLCHKCVLMSYCQCPILPFQLFMMLSLSTAMPFLWHLLPTM